MKFKNIVLDLSPQILIEVMTNIGFSFGNIEELNVQFTIFSISALYAVEIRRDAAMDSKQSSFKRKPLTEFNN